jgi:metallo-beta-lactamase family protein
VHCRDGPAGNVIVVKDSAHLQEEDAAYVNRSGYSRHRPSLPFDVADVQRAQGLFEPVELPA